MNFVLTRFVGQCADHRRERLGRIFFDLDGMHASVSDGDRARIVLSAMLTPRVFCLFLAVSCLCVAMPPLVHAKAQALDADPAQVAQWLEEISPEAWEQRLESSPELASVSLSLMGNALSG